MIQEIKLHLRYSLLCLFAACAEGWVNFRNNCYRLFHNKVKGANAKTQCANAHPGGELFTAHDSETQEFITKNFRHETYVQNNRPIERRYGKWVGCVYLGTA